MKTEELGKLDCNQVFCIEDEFMIGQEIKEVLEEYEKAIKSFDEGTSTYDLLVDRVSLYVPEDSNCYQEPLWVRKQQQKTFKRGKK